MIAKEPRADLTPYRQDLTPMKRNCQGPEGGFLRNTSTALILNRFGPRLIRLRRRLVRPMSDTEPTKTGARMNLSHLTPVRKEKTMGGVCLLTAAL